MTSTWKIHFLLTNILKLSLIIKNVPKFFDILNKNNYDYIDLQPKDSDH